MRSRVSQMLDFLMARDAEPYPQAAWQPAVDVYRCERGWLIKLDLAGVSKQDIEIHATGTSVMVSGTRRDWRVDQRQQAHLMEIAYSRFERRIELPEDVGQVELATEYRDGMLLVRVVTKQEAGP